MAGVDVLIVGGGVAGAACAEQLREDGFDGSILLAGREPDPPYHRPPITKGYLRGEESRDDAYVHPAEWWSEHDVDVRTRTSVTKLDTAARTATLSTKDEVSFDRALLATGANVRRLPVTGSDLEGIHYLRALRNADVLRDDTAEGDRVVLIGGSYIGCEVAASLTAMGRRCTVVMQEQLPLSTGFGPVAGRYFERVLTEHGVEVRGGEELSRFEGAGERVERVVLRGGDELEAAAVVLGVGAVPDVTLAKAAGLSIGDSGGIRCDDHLRTSAPGIWAAGDCCDYDSVVHRRRLRIEHWDVANEQGKYVARAMLGADEPYDVVPYFFSDLADWTSLEYVGPAADWETEELRGSPDDGEFAILYADAAGHVVAALSVGYDGAIDEAKRRMREAAGVDHAE